MPDARRVVIVAASSHTMGDLSTGLQSLCVSKPIHKTIYTRTFLCQFPIFGMSRISGLHGRGRIVNLQFFLIVIVILIPDIMLTRDYD